MQRREFLKALFVVPVALALPLPKVAAAAKPVLISTTAKILPKVYAGTVTLTGLHHFGGGDAAAAFARAFDKSVMDTVRAQTKYMEDSLFRTGA